MAKGKSYFIKQIFMYFSHKEKMAFCSKPNMLVLYKDIKIVAVCGEKSNETLVNDWTHHTLHSNQPKLERKNVSFSIFDPIYLLVQKIAPCNIYSN